MRRFVIRVALFFVTLFVFDRVIGYPLSYFSKHAKGGYIWRQNYITDSVHADVLVFGSSRAIHHYNPKIIEDSLGLTCFNCGQNGNGIINTYGWWQIIKERYKPSLVIYDFIPAFDIYAVDDNRKYLGWLKFCYDRPCIQNLFEEIDSFESFKMKSYLYRYNSRFHQIIADYLHPFYQVNDNGFVPLFNEIDTGKVKKKETIAHVDSLKISYLRKFIDEMNDVKLVIVVSPYYYGESPQMLKHIKEICQDENVAFIDYSNASNYLQNSIIFSDANHLNAQGADMFTKELVGLLKCFIAD